MITTSLELAANQAATDSAYEGNTHYVIQRGSDYSSCWRGLFTERKAEGWKKVCEYDRGK